MDIVDITIKVICTPIFAKIVETGGIKALIDFANKTLLQHRLPIPPAIIQSVNSQFGSRFTRLSQNVKQILHDIDHDSIPQLQYIEPRYTEVLQGPSPRCLSALLYGVKVNIEMTETLLSLCDECVKPLEIVSCAIVTLPSKCVLKPHRSEYCGVLSYIVVIDGSKLAHLKINTNLMTLTSKAAVFFDPVSMISFSNTGPSEVVILKIEMYRPFNIGFDAVNWSALQVIGESDEVQYAAKMSNM